MSYENLFLWIFWITECSVQPSLCCFSINFFKGSVFFGFKLCNISYAWLIVGTWLADGTALIPRSFFNVLWVALLGTILFSKLRFTSSLTPGYTQTNQPFLLNEPFVVWEDTTYVLLRIQDQLSTVTSRLDFSNDIFTITWQFSVTCHGTCLLIFLLEFSTTNRKLLIASILSSRKTKDP